MVGRLAAALFGTSLMMTGTSAAQQAIPSGFQAPIGLYAGAALGQSIFWDTELVGGGELEYDFFALFVSGALGYRLSPSLRVEGELLYETADVDNSFVDIEIFRSTVSGYYDFAARALSGYQFRPYAGGGLGLAYVELFDDDLGLTWHVESGASVSLTDRVDLVPGIRFEYNAIDENVVDDDSVWVTQFRAGLRYSF